MRLEGHGELLHPGGERPHQPGRGLVLPVAEGRREADRRPRRLLEGRHGRAVKSLRPPGRGRKLGALPFSPAEVSPCPPCASPPSPSSSPPRCPWPPRRCRPRSRTTASCT